MQVLIADDHALVRQGLAELLRAARPGWRFAEAGSLDQALEQLAAGAVDLLLIDLHMPGMEGGGSLRDLREVYPDLRIAVLTAAEERETILECLAAGVHGYIPKSTGTGQLISAVDTVLAGGIHVPPSLTQLAQGRAAALAARPDRVAALTPRQKDVLDLLAEGRSTKDIARLLGLGIGTVKVHLAGVYRALGASNRMEAVVRAGRLRAGG